MLHLLRDPLRPQPHPAPVLAAFAGLGDGVRAALAGIANPDRHTGLLIRFAWFWLVRASRRLDALYVRWQSGRYRPAPPRPARPRRERLACPDRVRVPRRHGWLVRIAQGAVYGASAMPELLKDADFNRFLHEVAGARRTIRALARMTGAELPETLRLPPRPRKPRPKPDPAPERPPRPVKYGSRAFYELLNRGKTWPDCYGPKRWAPRRPP